MKLFVCPNSRTKEQQKTAAFCMEKLEARTGAVCSLSREKSELIFGNADLCRFEPEDADIIVAIGGDGAVLRASHRAVAANKPLLGINGGRLGFLCAYQPSELDLLSRDFAEKLVSSERTLLEYDFDGKSGYALNDIIVAKSTVGATVQMKLSVNGEEITELLGDGVVISTPTGSTAYGYSSGGPVLSPFLCGIAITPVCPHGGIRPVVIPDDREITVKIIRASGDGACICADGNDVGFSQGEINIRKYAKKLTLLTKKSFVSEIK